MTAQWLFIPLIVLFHLLEILGGRAREIWHALCGFHFFWVPVPINVPLQLQCGQAHTDVSWQTPTHCLIDKTTA
jgi:hypothetical protein